MRPRCTLCSTPALQPKVGNMVEHTDIILPCCVAEYDPCCMVASFKADLRTTPDVALDVPYRGSKLPLEFHDELLGPAVPAPSRPGPDVNRHDTPCAWVPISDTHAHDYQQVTLALVLVLVIPFHLVMRRPNTGTWRDYLI